MAFHRRPTIGVLAGWQFYWTATPEGTSNGLIQMFGQAAVVFVYIMEALKSPDGSFTPSLLLAVGLLIVSAAIITQLQDPQVGERANG